MANAENDQADQAAKESLMASLITALRDHRQVLRFLPEMMEELIEIQKAEAYNVHKSGNVDESNIILIQRENKELKEKVAFMRDDIKMKEKRIIVQDQTIKDHKGHIDALIGTPNTKPEELRNDDLISEVNNKVKLLKEQTEKISTLECELKAAKRYKAENDTTMSSLENELAAAKRDKAEKDTAISSLERELEKEKRAKVRKDSASTERPSSGKTRIHQLEEQHRVDLCDKDKEVEEIKNRLHQQEEQHRVVLCEKDEEIKAIRNKNEDLTRSIEAKNDQITAQAERHELLKKKSKDVFTSKENEIEQMKSRIASLSERLVRQDQSKVEDTLSMNRPSTLEVDFKNFIDEARVDACERIQSLYNSKEETDVRIYYPRLACLIFEVAYERMKEAKEAFFEVSKEAAKGLIQSAPNVSHLFSTYEKQRYHSFDVSFHVSLLRQASLYPSDVVDALVLNLKETAHDCDLQLFVQDVQRSVWDKWRVWCEVDKWCRISPKKALLQDSKIILYINKCMRLAWRMVTQVPPMTVEYQSQYLGDIHKNLGYHSSPVMISKLSTDEDTRVEIACYIWPGLFDGRGRMIHPGEVLCKVKK